MLRLCSPFLFVAVLMALYNPIEEHDILSASVKGQTVKKEEISMMYKEAEVTFHNKVAGITLSGTLTIPGDNAKHPAAILVHGQGPMNRDQSLLGMSPFKTMAHDLAGRGIATLRYDKRGIGKSEGDFATTTLNDLASDVQAAHEWLTMRDEIYSNKIGLIGTSEGGIVAQIVAGESDQIAFCITLAGPVLAGTENLVLSFAILANGNLSRDQSFVMYRDQLRKLLELVNGPTSPSDAGAEAIQLATHLIPNLINDNTRILFGGVDQVTPEELIGMLSSSCFTAPFVHDPKDYLPLIECPILALYGGKDVHVPAPEHIAEIRRILKGCNNKDYMIKEFPDANHLFQKCQTGFPVEYMTLDHDISPEVLEFIGSWILERTKGEEE
jgi:alpha/beta superfamily hydrolase